MPFKLSNLHEHNSELLKLLTQHLPDMLWVKDTEGTYIYVNKALCDGLLMAKDTLEPIGKGDVFFALREREAHKDKPDWHTFGELCFDSDQTVIDNNKAMKFEEYGNVKGKLLYLEVYKAPFYDKNGKTIGTVGAGRDITKLKQTQLRLEKSLRELDKQQEILAYQVNHDELTNLPNRRLLLDRLRQAISKSQRFNTKVAVIFIDLDHFKVVNDSVGHHIGDKLLIEYSIRLKNKMRMYDTLARLGGDEFCIILDDITDMNDVSNFISNIMLIPKESFVIDNHTFHINMSVGISIYPDDDKNTDVLLKNSDAALYKAKENGRNRFCFYNKTMTDAALEIILLENALHEAFINDELVVYYQPQIDAKKKYIDWYGSACTVGTSNNGLSTS